MLVSACLLGRPCRFDAKEKRSALLVEALARFDTEAVPFCPEEAGGLGTPRPPAVVDGGDGEAVLDGRARVVDASGLDVTNAFVRGAREAVRVAVDGACGAAYLKERSPSCGCTRIHSPQGLRPGAGVTAALLRRAGVAIISVDR